LYLNPEVTDGALVLGRGLRACHLRHGPPHEEEGSGAEGVGVGPVAPGLGPVTAQVVTEM